MHWTLAYTTACTTVQAVITACLVVQTVLTVCTVVSCINNFSTNTVPQWLAAWATGAPQKVCGSCTPHYVLLTLNKRNSYEYKCKQVRQ